MLGGGVRFRSSTSGEDGTKSSFSQDAGGDIAMIALDLDPAFFDSPSRATGALHVLGQGRFFLVADSDESRHNGHGLTTSVSRLTNDIHSPAIALLRGYSSVSSGRYGFGA